MSETDQILAMNKSLSIAEKTITLLTREKGVLQESLSKIERQLSEKTVALNVAETSNKSEIDRMRQVTWELEEQEKSKQNSLGLLKWSNAQLTTQVDDLSAQVVDLEARNSKLLSEKQELLTRYSQLEEKKQIDSTINKKKMSILEEIMMRRNKR